MAGDSSNPRKLIFALIIFVVVAGGAELLTRATMQDRLALADGPPPQPEDGAPTLKGNPYLLWEQAPGVRVEHSVTANINSMGLRGEEPVIPKPDGVRRLLVTGDSSVYGFRVEDHEVFIQRTAALLGGQEQGIEGWNAAIPGYSTYQTINMLELRAWALEPDVLVIANIWSDNNFDSFVDRELLNAYSTFDDGFSARIHGLLTGGSAFYRLLTYETTIARGQQAEARKVGWMTGSGEQIGKRRVDVNDYAANLERLVRGAQDRGAEVAFVMLANEDDMRGPRREPAAWSLYRQVMQDTATRHGAPLIDVPPMFYATGADKRELFVDEMHPTAKGHELIAQALAEALKPWAAGEPLMTDAAGGAVPEYEDTFLFGDGGAGGSKPPEAGQQPDAPPQPYDQRGERIELSGELRWVGASGNEVQIDAVHQPSQADPADNLGNMRLPGPGPFTLSLRKSDGPITFVIYDDADDSKSPSEGDVRKEIRDHGLTLDASMSGLIVDVDAGTITAP